MGREPQADVLVDGPAFRRGRSICRTVDGGGIVPFADSTVNESPCHSHPEEAAIAQCLSEILLGPLPMPTS